MEDPNNITVAQTKRTPSDFLKQVLGNLKAISNVLIYLLSGRPVVVKLNTGEDYRGSALETTIQFL